MLKNFSVELKASEDKLIINYQFWFILCSVSRTFLPWFETGIIKNVILSYFVKLIINALVHSVPIVNYELSQSACNQVDNSGKLSMQIKGL